jgi:hypothetical protein
VPTAVPLECSQNQDRLLIPYKSILPYTHTRHFGAVAKKSCKNSRISFAMFVCLSPYNNSRRAELIFMTFNSGEFWEDKQEGKNVR